MAERFSDDREHALKYSRDEGNFAVEQKCAMLEPMCESRYLKW